MNESTVHDNDEELILLRESAANFAKKSLSPGRLRTLREKNLCFDKSIWKKFGELGWCALLIPESNDGLGLSLRHMTVILEELGSQLLPEPLVPTGVLSTLILTRCTNETLKDQLLPQLCLGNLIAATAWQDPQSLNSIPQSSFIRTPSNIKISGKKIFIRPGRECDGFIISLGTGTDRILCWVPAETPGLTYSTEICADYSSSGIISFNNLQLPNSLIIAEGDFADSLLRDSVDAATIATSAELLGLMRGAFKLISDHISTRVQFGRKIGAFQAIQHRMVDLYIQTRLSGAAVYDAAIQYSRASVMCSSTSIASRAKSRCSDAALQVTREAVQLHGAIGFTDEHDISQYLNRALVLSAWLGNSAQHRRRYMAALDDSQGT